MRKFIITTAAVLGVFSWLYFALTGFNGFKCEHVFTQVEQEVVKMETPSIYGSAVYAIGYYPTGLQEGKELICVKCLHKQKQILDYGRPVGLHSYSWPDTIRMPLSIDSVGPITRSFGAIHYLSGDTIKLGR